MREALRWKWSRGRRRFLWLRKDRLRRGTKRLLLLSGGGLRSIAAGICRRNRRASGRRRAVRRVWGGPTLFSEAQRKVFVLRLTSWARLLEFALASFAQ